MSVLCTAFTALYWNRFLALSAGSTLLYVAEQVIKGRMPYRDFLFLVPPLQIWKTVSLVWVFGDHLAVPRFAGMLERTAVGVLMYLWLTRFCRPASAMLASFVTLVQFATDPADSIESYHHASVLWAIAGGICAGSCLKQASRTHEGLAAGAAGFFCSLSLLTKQTTGAGVLLAVAVVLGVFKWRYDGILPAVRNIALLIVGALLPIIAITGWLWHARSLAPFLHTMFTSTTSKGSPLAVLSRPFLQLPWLFFPVAAVTPLLARMVSRAPLNNRPASLSTLLALAVGGGLTLGAGVASLFSVWTSRGTLAMWTWLAQSAMLTFCITGNALIFLHYSVKFVRRGLTLSEGQVWLMSAVSVSVAYMLGLSFAVYGPMAAPGLALITALALDRLEGSGSKSFWALVSLLLILTSASVSQKLRVPFAWMSWPEPSIIEATHVPTHPKLAGLRLSEPTLSLTETIVKLVKEHTKPGDSLVVYPYFPLFYSMTGLDPPTYNFNYYLDVCPDEICRQAAATLLSKPPDAIVYMVEDEEGLARDESLYRSGGKSGSRDVVRAIEELKPVYQTLLSASIPGTSRRIEVYVRPQPDRKVP